MKKIIGLGLVVLFIITTCTAFGNTTDKGEILNDQDYDINVLIQNALSEEHLLTQNDPAFEYKPFTTEAVPSENTIFYEPGEVIVSFKSGKNMIDVSQLTSFDGNLVIDRMEELNVALIQVEKDSEMEFIDKVAKRSDVHFAELNTFYSAYGRTPDDPSYTYQQNLVQIKCPDAWSSGWGKNRVTVAVLDTGVDYSHTDRASYTIRGRAFVFPWAYNSQDGHGHGTHCAGIVAANINNGKGIAGVTEAKILGVKVLNNFGMGTAYSISRGITWAANNGAWIISMSLGSASSSSLTSAACNYAYTTKKVLIVAAAGNENRAGVSYPARYSTVIAVGSVNSQGTRSYFSNYGAGLELMAPGESIYSTLPNNRYGRMSGTSMAAPHVAGVAARYYDYISYQKNPSRCRNWLRNTADLKTGQSSYYYGYGLVDATLT